MSVFFLTTPNMQFDRGYANALRLRLLKVQTLEEYIELDQRARARFGDVIGDALFDLTISGVSDKKDVMPNGIAASSGVLRDTDLLDLCVGHVLSEDIPPEDAEAVAYFAQRCRAPGTIRSWRSRWSLISCYGARFDRSILPMSEGTLCRLVSHMALAGYALGSIRDVVTVVKVAHRFKDLPTPTSGRDFQLVMDGIAREIGSARRYAKKALFNADLEHCCDSLARRPGRKALQNRTILLLGWHSALRRENLVALNIEDVTFADDDTYIGLYIRRSKTDRHARGDEIFIDAIPGSPYCPVYATRRWIDEVGEDSGPLFRHLGVNEAIDPERISDRTVCRIVQMAVRELGLRPEEHGAHSMRAGFVTQSNINGVDLVTTAKRTLHTDINSILGYHRPGRYRINLSIAATTGKRVLIGPRETDPGPLKLSE